MICGSFNCVVIVFSVFFFKQKTAYEMRISDSSSDVCSSDLAVAPFRQLEEVGLLLHPLALGTGRRDLRPLRAVGELALGVVGLVAHRVPAAVAAEIDVARFDQLLP